MNYKIDMRLIKKSLYGKEPVIQLKYDFESWEDTNWFFRTATEKKVGWIFVPEFKLWRSNVSI